MSASDDAAEVYGCLMQVLVFVALFIVFGSSDSRRSFFRSFRHATESIRADWHASVDSLSPVDVGEEK